MILNKEIASNIDASNMFDILLNFPKQIEHAIEIGKNAPTLDTKNGIPNKFMILGMGGSAIGGDTLRAYSQATQGADHLNISVSRNYSIPKFVDKDFCVIASSYSGGTEETLSAFAQAQSQTDKLIAISSGGKLSQIAESSDIPLIKIPGGMMPRCAVAYSFFPLLFQLIRIGAYKQNAIDVTLAAIEELLPLLKKRSEELAIIDEKNPAIQIAQRLVGSAAVVYSACERLDTVNLRWRGQIQENAKQLAFGALLPEMNHNEINSWSFPQDMLDRFVIIMLKDIDDNPRTKIRFEAIEEILKPIAKDIINIESESKYLLTRIFDLVYLADWVSYYLSLLNGTDPTPIPLISKLKDILAAKV